MHFFKIRKMNLVRKWKKFSAISTFWPIFFFFFVDAKSEMVRKMAEKLKKCCILTPGSIDVFFQDSKNEPSQKRTKFFWPIFVKSESRRKMAEKLKKCCILTPGSIDVFFQDSKNEPSQKIEKKFHPFC